MISSLSIRNFILIESVDLEFQPGFTVITGETGAGKSILIDALLCALGERMHGEIIKKGRDKGFVEAIFHIPVSLQIPENVINEGYVDAFPSGDKRTIIIRREFTAKGLNRSFINDSPATASMARSLGEVLIDFHGQHDHQSLLNTDTHLTFLDAYSDTYSELSDYTNQWEIVRKVAKRYEDLIARKDDILKNRDRILFSLREIEDIHPLPGELEQLEQEMSRIKHAVYITEKQQVLSHIIHEDDASILSMIGKIKHILEDVSALDSAYEPALSELQSASASLQEVHAIIKERQSDEYINPDKIQERMSTLMWLKKKYGSIDKVFTEWESLKEQASISEDIDGEIANLKQLLSKEQEILGSKADILSQKRLASIPAFQSYIESSLRMMGIEKPTFKVSHLNQSIKQFDDTHLIANTSNGPFIAYSHGIDIIEFMLSLNSGEACKPLVKAASGGEISRIMLALKSLINEKAGVPVMVFDEIDTGISGKVARKVGSVMKQLGIHKQVIAISHSPQIASLADNHVLVRKTSASDSTKVDAMTVIDDERIKEIASLISGETLTETTIESAKELLSAKDIHKG